MGSFFAPREWGPLLTAMVTPFGGNDNVNIAEVKRIAAYLVDVQKNTGLVINGTTGESPTTDEDEKFAVLEAVLEAVGDRAAVVFGAGTYNTKESIHLTREGEKRGAHGIMAVNPYYNKPGQDGLEAHFKAIAGATTLPVMLYNIFPRSAINLETSTLLKLAEIPNIVAVKEASGNIPQISDVIAQSPAGFRVYCGDDLITLPTLALGAHGVVSVAGHVIGDEIWEMLSAFPTDVPKARAIHHRLTPKFKALFSCPNPVPVKYALSQRGFDCEAVRLPLVGMTDAQKALVTEALA